jgi:hypothetical protein
VAQIEMAPADQPAQCVLNWMDCSWIKYLMKKDDNFCLKL